MKCCLLCVSLCIMQNKNGELSERFMEPVLKTGDRRDSAVGSNPTLSAIYSNCRYQVAQPQFKESTRNGGVNKLRLVENW